MKILREKEAFAEVEINPSLPVFCDTETAEEEGKTSGGLYGRIRLFQLFQFTWDNAVVTDCDFVPLQNVLDLIQPFHLIFHSAAYDLHTINLHTEETWLPRDVGDTMYLSRLKYFTKTRFTLYDCLEHAHLNDDFIDSINKKEQQKSDWDGPISDIQYMYACADVTYLCQLYEDVKEYEISSIYKLDIETLKLAVDFARNGMPINQKTVRKLRKKYILRLEEVLRELPINPRSHIQSKKYLGSATSDSDTLVKLIQQGSERAKLVQEGRHCYKSLEYLKAYNRPILKGFFQPSASLSGRFSCTGGNSYNHANLQQMPEKLHSVVEAPKGYVIVYKDYSGLELRMAVAYTGEPVMAAMMKQGADLHTETGKYIFNKDEISVLERRMAKTFNFGLIYGGGAVTTQNTLIVEADVHMPLKEVSALIVKWFDLYETYREWHNIHKNFMNVYGYIDVETALGRKVRAYQLTDSLNIPIQGSSVEVTKMSLCYLKRRYPDAYIIDTIHDANLLLAKEEEAEMWGNRLSECMVDAWTYVTSELAEPNIPMPHGYESGPIWTFH